MASPTTKTKHEVEQRSKQRIEEGAVLFTKTEASELAGCKISLTHYFVSNGSLPVRIGAIYGSSHHLLTDRQVVILCLLNELRELKIPRTELSSIAIALGNIRLCDGLDLYWVNGHLLAIEVGNYHKEFDLAIGRILTSQVLQDRSQYIEQWQAFLITTRTCIDIINANGAKGNVFQFAQRSISSCFNIKNKIDHPGWLEHPGYKTYTPSYDLEKESVFHRQLAQEIAEQNKPTTYKEQGVPKHIKQQVEQVTRKMPILAEPEVNPDEDRIHGAKVTEPLPDTATLRLTTDQAVPETSESRLIIKAPSIKVDRPVNQQGPIRQVLSLTGHHS